MFPDAPDPRSILDLSQHGLTNLRSIHANLPPAVLVELIVRRSEGILSNSGAVVVTTGAFTGRSAQDKFIVRHSSSTEDVWWGNTNSPIAPEQFARLLEKMQAYLQGKDVFVQDLAVGAHPKYQVPIRVITESAWSSLFSWNLFVRNNLSSYLPAEGYTIFHAPGFQANPAHDGTRSGVFIIIDFQTRQIIIGGTGYAGEIKKSIFTVMNYILPHSGVLSMHCSANVGKSGDSALFFGLSGTGKTTLSSDPDRRLVGDDEHGWGDEGIFNFEGGCYAKTIHLRQELEPLIWSATNSFGSVLENVVIDPHTRQADFDSSRYTENTRAAYPLFRIANRVPDGAAGHPQHIFFLTADAFGILPPIARLTPEQAMVFFLSGYTSKLAGTEKGLGAEPVATFSTCFGAPFLPLHPGKYAALLGEKIHAHQSQVWLINTGWTGGPYGTGRRIDIPHTRALIRAALTGKLARIPTRQDPNFGIAVPLECPGVPSVLLNPRRTWSNEARYDQQAQVLVARFIENFSQYTNQVPERVLQALPGLAT